MKKRVVAFLLAALMAVTVVGCGNGSDNSSNSNSGGSDSTSEDGGSDDGGSEEGSESGSAASDIEKPEKIKVMMDGTVFTKNNAQEEFFAALTEATGIEYEVTQPDHDAYYDVLGQTFASGDWPDVVILGSTYFPGYASEGILWDMSEAWQNSDLKASGRVTAENVIDSLYMGDALYGFAPTRGNGCITYVKQSWLDAVGLEAPTTYDEYIAMLDAFLDHFGSYGISSAGLIGNEAPYINYLPEFYQDAYPAFYLTEDGTWVDGFEEDAMKDAMLRLQSAYDAGYIDKESLTNGTNDCRTKFYEDKFGVFTYWAGTWNTNLSSNLIANDLDGDLVALEPIAEVGEYLERVPPVWAITQACDNPEGVFKYFIEAMLDGGEVQSLWTYGVEDVHWSAQAEEVLGVTYEEGEAHMRESLELEGTAYAKHHIDPMLAIAGFADDFDDKLAATIAPEALTSQQAFNDNARMADLVIATDEMGQYNGDLTSLKAEIVALVVTQGMSIDDAYAKYEADGGVEWSKIIVESLNQ